VGSNTPSKTPESPTDACKALGDIKASSGTPKTPNVSPGTLMEPLGPDDGLNRLHAEFRYQSRPNGSASEIKSTPRLSARGANFVTVRWLHRMERRFD